MDDVDPAAATANSDDAALNRVALGLGVLWLGVRQHRVELRAVRDGFTPVSTTGSLRILRR